MQTQSFQNQALLRVGGDDNYMLLAPRHGGRLVRWVHRGTDILYWPDQPDWNRPAKIRGGNPLLFPFIGRHFVEGAAGYWKDDEGQVLALPQHGFARDLPFEVTTEDDGAAINMALHADDATRAGYPYDFLFEVSYRLLPDGLEARMRVRNTGSRPLPYYAGHHFYFALPHALRSQSVLSLPDTERVRQHADGSLTPPERGESRYALDDPRLQDTFHVLGASPVAMLEMPGRTIEFDLAVPGRVPWHAVTTWSESESADFYCVEPWLGLPNAIHHGQGLRWVDPGQQEDAICRMRVAG